MESGVSSSKPTALIEASSHDLTCLPYRSIAYKGTTSKEILNTEPELADPGSVKLWRALGLNKDELDIEILI